MISRRVPEIGLVSVVVVWASTFALTKQAFQEVSPLAFACVRFAGISVLAVAVLAVGVRTGQAEWRVRKRDLPRFVAAGVCGYTLYQLGFVLGLERTSPFSSSLLIGSVPLFTIVLLALLGERPPVQAWLGVGASLLGAAIFLVDKAAAPGSLVGDLLSLGSAISFAIYGVISRPLVKHYPMATYTAYTILAGAVPLIALSLTAAAAQDWERVSTGSWIIIAYMVVLPVYVAYMVWNWAIARCGVAVATGYTLLTPIASGLLSAVALQEAFGVLKLIGAGLVLIGLLLLQGSPRAQPPLAVEEPLTGTRSATRSAPP
jgi:drug/metabolite transporter (DMT)-like permease